MILKFICAVRPEEALQAAAQTAMTVAAGSGAAPAARESSTQTPSLSLVGGSSQLPRLATGRAAVTNGYSHRMFC